ncbi:MAG: hypothetical protein R3B13_08160 [Polyangiaceae bacterium]
MKVLRLLPALILPAVLVGCPKDKTDDERLTLAEASEAVQEASLASQAENLTSASVEISTSFTIGQAVENAAQEIKTFVSTQLPCAQITLDKATLTIVYGALPGNCTYKGHTFEGSHSISVNANDNAQVEVHHEWTAFSNGKVTLDGSADVTWDLQAKSRRVQHTATWTRNSDQYTVVGSGDRTQSVLDGGILEGIQVDGSRNWKTPRGEWDLAIDGVQMRWVDPVPQAGSYTLVTPKGKSLALSFDRVDEDTIKVTVSANKGSFSFNVNKIGAVNNNDTGA